MDTESYIQRLIEISNNKYTLLEKVLQTYLLQDEELALGGSSNQEALITKRDELMAEIDKHDERFHIYTERLKSTLGITSLEELSIFKVDSRSELKAAVSRISNLLGVLADKHNEVKRKISNELQVTSEQVTQINKSKLVSRAYQSGNMSPATSVYYDKKK